MMPKTKTMYKTLIPNMILCLNLTLKKSVYELVFKNKRANIHTMSHTHPLSPIMVAKSGLGPNGSLPYSCKRNKWAVYSSRE